MNGPLKGTDNKQQFGSFEMDTKKMGWKGQEGDGDNLREIDSYCEVIHFTFLQLQLNMCAFSYARLIRF